MKIIGLIVMFETAALMVWSIYKFYARGHQQMRTVEVQPPILTINGRRKDAWSINERLVEGQPDDRRPLNGVVTAFNKGGASSGRSFARKLHQQMYKKWSQERRITHE